MEQTYTRHWFPPVAMILGGLGVEVLISWCMWLLHKQNMLTYDLYLSGGCMIVLVILLTYAGITLYYLSKLVVSTDQINVVYWPWLFASSEAVCEWSDVEDITIVQPGFFALILGFGTVTIETAGTKPNLTLSYLPGPENIRDALMRQVESVKAAGTPQHP